MLKAKTAYMTKQIEVKKNKKCAIFTIKFMFLLAKNKKNFFSLLYNFINNF